jgi:excisionase family DNA binding protein
VIDEPTPAAPVAPRLLTRADAARALGIGITKFKELVAAGTIAKVTIGRRVLIPPAALDDYVARLCAEQNGNGRTNRGRSPRARADANRPRGEPEAGATTTATAKTRRRRGEW